MAKYFQLICLFFAFIGTNKASIVVLNGLTHIYKVDKGETYKGKIEIQNTGTTPQSVKIYLQDLSYKADGSIYYSPPFTNKKTNAGWVKFNTDLLTIKAKEKTEVYYEVTIPDSIAQTGSYWSAIIVEPVSEIMPNSNQAGVHISSIVRYAIQLITDYHSSELKPNLKFESIKLEKDGQKQSLKVALTNNGVIYCKSIVSIELYDQKSEKKIGVFSSQAMSLLPSTSKSFHIDLNNVPSGIYNAVVMATDDDENAFALRTELKIKND
ncbi:WxL protein host-binding domain-containing protein [Sphingobacterium sp. Lzh-3]|uniref:COG1470 family protein n=1 Tax=Sphingobacterium sp. Lzh-3 TaxID=3382150 RepID=UPI00398CA4AB